MGPLRDAALAAARNAWAPYSGYRVGAALEAEDGRVFTGCNVENASFGITMCAERVALGAAVAAGVRRFERIVIVADGQTPPAPCGACRQALAEFSPDMEIQSFAGTEQRSWTLDSLLPARFELRAGAVDPADGG